MWESFTIIENDCRLASKLSVCMLLIEVDLLDLLIYH